MAKKFDKPTQIKERKGLDILIGGEEKKAAAPEKKYTTYNVQVRQDFKEKIYAIKAKTGMKFFEIFDMVFDDYFERNPT